MGADPHGADATRQERGAAPAAHPGTADLTAYRSPLRLNTGVNPTEIAECAAASSKCPRATWLNSGVGATEVAERAGNSAEVLLSNVSRR